MILISNTIDYIYMYYAFVIIHICIIIIQYKNSLPQTIYDLYYDVCK